LKIVSGASNPAHSDQEQVEPNVKTDARTSNLKRLLIIGLLVGVAAWATAYIIASREESGLLSNRVDETERLAQFFENETQLLFRYADTYVKSVRREFLRYGNLTEVRTYLKEAPLDTTLISHITIIDQEGTPIWVSNREPRSGVTALDRDYFQIVKSFKEDQLYVSQSHRGRNTGKVTVRLVRAIRDKSGAFRGVVFASIEEQNLVSFINNLNLDKNSFAALIGSDKRLRAHSTPGLFEPGADLSELSIWNRANQTQKGDYYVLSAVDGREHFYSYRQMENFPLIVLVGMTLEDVTTHLNHFKFTSYGFAAIISLGILFTLMFRRRDLLASAVLRARETQLNIALDNMTGGMFMFDADMRVQVASPSFQHYYEFPADMVTPGSPVIELMRLRQSRGDYGDGDAATLVNQRIAIYKCQEPMTVVDSPPSGRLLELSLSPMDSGGTVGVFTDITERRQSELRLQTNERNFRSIIDNIPIGINLKDENGFVIQANKQILEWWGLPETEVLGKTTDEISGDPPDICAARQRQEREVWETQQASKRKQTEKRRRDGRIQHISITKIPIVDDDGNMVSLCNMIEDVTDQMNAEKVLTTARDDLEDRVIQRTRELELARDEAEAANRLKSQLITTMNHELRTPLTSIIGSLRLITNRIVDPASDDALELLGVAARNSDQLALLVNDILDTEKLDSGAIELQMRPLDVAELVKQSVKLYAGYGEEFDVRFRIGETEPDLQIMADEARLLQVMANLLSNAAKFSPKDGTVTVSATRTEKGARIQVSDNGSGIPVDMRQTVFDKFVRGDNIDARNSGGAGLGLYITRSIVEAHQGTIEFETENGVGTAFFILLPLLQSADA